MSALFFLLIVLAVSACVFASNSTLAVGAYNGDQAMISVWLSAAASCGKDEYKTRTFKGPTTGFVVSSVVTDTASDTQGYVGYLPSDKSIYVVFRGSSSTRNWIENLDAVKTAYTSYPECKCQVHKGFYQAEQKVIGGIVSTVKSLMSSHAGYAVKVTGHSLGAAMAQLTSMDLLKAGIQNTVYNFGQPRTGDKAYATFATAKIPTFRVTHNKDMVPHLPFTSGMDFYHVCREEFEDASGAVRTCDATCEDKTCADQYAFAKTNTEDHLTYLGFPISSCKAVSAVYKYGPM